MLTEFQKGWLVGILEGEGCFTIHRHAPDRLSPRVQLRMCDRDIVEKVRRMLLVYTTSMTMRSDLKGENQSVAYTIQLSGQPAARLMEDLRPFMGSRRQKRIDDIVSWWSLGADPSSAPRSNSGS